tara:strand:- start:196 stop:375 length:180 start_codon:yes stop_codon:yes gene_type:complete
MNSTSNPITIAFDSINSVTVKTGGGVIPDFGTGLANNPPSMQWAVLILIICLIYNFILN